ncbi:hypothetical protein L596_019942 [Steinernema carpocapsae]|uniref:Uncharacterized protein n=1 Tax=Steinernema carpocapsae TaxID=34508 RepID=A0A4U5MS96_STECR|nr:hypothetical protein L596_019942 [Steinernema carpocapsae]
MWSESRQSLKCENRSFGASIDLPVGRSTGQQPCGEEEGRLRLGRRCLQSRLPRRPCAANKQNRGTAGLPPRRACATYGGLLSLPDGQILGCDVGATRTTDVLAAAEEAEDDGRKDSWKWNAARFGLFCTCQLTLGGISGEFRAAIRRFNRKSNVYIRVFRFDRFRWIFGLFWNDLDLGSNSSF